MKIEMTSIYNPSVRLTAGKGFGFPLFVPYISADSSMRLYPNGSYRRQPQEPWGSSKDQNFAENRNIANVFGSDVEVVGVFDSYVPRLFSTKTVFTKQSEYISRFYPGSTASDPQLDKRFLGSMRTFAGFKLDAKVTVRMETDTSVAQPADYSNPSVGCFWFNDGSSERIELPRDNRCRANIIVRFKKWTLL